MPDKQTQVQVTVREVVDVAGRPEAVVCTLCGHDDSWVYWGLATFGIEYEGPTRFICGTCVSKIGRRS